MATENRDVLSLLPEMQWRGTKYQLVGLSWLRRWEQTFHQTLSCQYPEYTGPVNWLFTCTIACRNGIALKSNQNSGFKAILKLRDDCEKRQRGEYIDPIWGKWQCVATEFHGDIDPVRRDGVDVQVSFLHKPELTDPDAQPDGGLKTVGDLYVEANTLDDAIRKTLGVKRQKAPLPPLVDPLSGIAGLGKQIERQADRVAQSLASFSNRCKLIEEEIAKLEDPETFGIRREVRRLRAAAHALMKRINNTIRTTRTLVIRYQKAATTIAAQSGMTIVELLNLNPDLCRTPMVPAGTKVIVFSK